MQLAAAGEALDGPDVPSLDLRSQDQARPDRLAVEEYRAGPADPMLAPEMRAGQAGPVTKHVGERPADRQLQGRFVAVQLERDCGALDPHRSASHSCTDRGREAPAACG